MRRLMGVAVVFIVLAATSAVRAAGEPAIVEGIVSFTVENLNRSVVPCASDGKTYAVRGVLVADLLEATHGCWVIREVRIQRG